MTIFFFYRKIYAVEMNDQRYKTLCDFVTLTGAECVETMQTDALTLPPEKYENVQYILVDPSCSGSGMVDRIETRIAEENLYGRLRKLRSLQSMILNYALSFFPNVKKVVYSTCSIYPEENETVVDEAARKFGDTFSVVNLRKKLNNEWHNFGSSEHSYKGDKCLYALPDKDLCSGFFLAMFKRKSKLQDVIVNEIPKSINGVEASEAEDIEEKTSENYEVPIRKGKRNRPDLHESMNKETTDEEHVSKKAKKKRDASKEKNESTDECEAAKVKETVADEHKVTPKKEKKTKTSLSESKEFFIKHETTETENLEELESSRSHKVSSKKVKKEKKIKKDKCDVEMVEQ